MDNCFNQEEISARVVSVIENVLGRDAGLGQKLYDDLGMDSLEHGEILVSLDKEFDLPAESEEFSRNATVQEVVDHVCLLLQR